MPILSMFHPEPERVAPAAADRTAAVRRRSSDNAANPYVEVAARLLSETAHDIRSPLAGVRELVRLVCDGELGATNAAQREMLGEAMRQCDVIAGLVDNMLQLDRLRSGLPRTRRQWFIPTAIPSAVDAAIRSAATARRVAVRWDGFDGRHGPLFGDEPLIRRLLVNLVGNAIAVSEQGRSVLVRMSPPAATATVRLSVCDQGPGLSEESFGSLAARGVSGTGGSGLGLAISRTLAALHFAQLTVESRVGEGTEIGFELPAAGPASVADALYRWRALAATRGAATRGAATRGAATRSAATRGGGGEPRGSEREPHEARRTIPFDGPRPRFPAAVTIVTLRGLEKTTRLGSGGGREQRLRELQAIDDLLQSDQRLHELVYRTDSSRWVLLWDNSPDEARRRIASVESQLRNGAASFELVWSEPIEQPVAGRGDRTRLREWLVRDALQASSRPVVRHDRSGRQQDPSQESVAVASRRLDAELVRLSHRLRHQTDQLQTQADRLTKALRS
ncbi:sensor histidine kinase [Candidatus Laterigemmans baculatus]|uniref:sensor histidine kinase n=1 Tax=Candidatus Laterigemmans baculatus TaxID=2770505 RepID=UPI0013DA0FBA|nr:HAMP domain-containing sensor histidine kinase [Candidatus Laterigemmans baculatus]